MKKTLFLSAILGAALCSSAFGAVSEATCSTTIGGVTYNGGVYTMTGTSAEFHQRTFTADQASDDGTTVQAGDTVIWNLGFCNPVRAASGTDYQYGNTLHLGETTTNQTATTSFGAFSLGGLIVDEGSGTWTIGRNTTATETRLEGNGAVNMDINGSLNLLGGNGISIIDGGTWDIAQGKTLTLTSGNSNIAFSDGAAVTVQGGGNLAFSRSIVLNGASSLTLADGTGIVLDNLTKNTSTEGSESGLQTATTTYTLASGTGSVSKTGTVNLLLGGETIEGATFATDNKSVSVSQYSYCVAEGDTKTLAEANTTIGEASGTVANITVDGTLSDFSTAAHTTGLDIAGSGTIKVNGELQYHTAGNGHTYLNDFAGTLEIADGGTLQAGNGSNVLSNNVTLKVTEGGTVKSWGSGMAHAIVLDGGDLNQAGAATTYSGTITVESSSSVTGTGDTTTLSGTTNVKAGVLTTHGNVTQSGTLDMNGPQSGRFSGALVVADGTFTSTSTASLWVSSATDGITVKDGATFKKGQMTLTTKSGSDATIATTRTEGAAYTTGGSNSNTFTISNADLVFGSTETATLTNALVNVSVTGGKTEDAETGAVTYKTTVNSTSMSNVTLKDVNLSVGNSLSGVTLDNVTYTANGAYLNIGGTVNMGDFTNNMSGNSSNNYGIIVGANGQLNITGTVDLTKKSDGTANANAHVAGANGTATVTVKEGGHLTTDLFLNSSQTKTSNGNLVVEAGGQLDVTGTGNHHAYSFSNAGTTFINSGLYIYDGTLTNSGDLTLCSGNISYTNVVLGGGTVSIYNRSSEAEHVYGVADEATLTVTHQLTVNASSTVNADIVVAANGVVTFNSGTVTLGCSVTFGEGSTVALGTAYLDDLAANGKVLLFTDVESYSDNLESIVVTGDFAPGHLFAEAYTAEGGVTKFNIYATPEPATATLSLLALAGLMARRKRH